MTESPIFDLQTLVKHREFLRSIARSIVLDEHRAEDVVQQSWVAALERPPQNVRSVKWWLARVVTNFAKKSVNRDREQREREQSAARSEISGDQEATLDFERFEHVASALRGLPEPYRTTIHLRYFKGLSPSEIAATEKVSLETVRTRLKRGLAILRTECNERFGGRDACFAALIAFADPRSVAIASTTSVSTGSLAATSSILNGILIMKLFALSAAVLAVIAVAAISVRGAKDSEHALTATAAASALEDGSSISRTKEFSIDAPTKNNRFAVVAPIASSKENSPAVSTRRGRFHVVDSLKLPVPSVTYGNGAGEEWLTDSNGVGKFELPAESGSETFKLSAEGYLTSYEKVSFESEGDVDFGPFTLLLGGTVHGMVLDPKKVGVADALVVVTSVDEPFGGITAGLIDTSRGTPRAHVRTDASGEFELIGIRPGTMRLWASAPGLQDAASSPIEITAAGRSDHVRIQLKAAALADQISGRVVLPVGISSPGLTVWYSRDSFEGQRTQTAPVELDGSFRIQLEARDEHDVWVQEDMTGWDDRREVWTGEHVLQGFRSTIARDVEPGTTNLILGFEPTRGIEIEAKDHQGKLVEPFELLIYTRSGEDLAQEQQWSRNVTHPVKVDVPATKFWVIVIAAGYDYGSQGPFDTESAPSEISFELDALPNTTGRVTAEGAPVIGARVELFGVASREHLIKSHGFQVRTATSTSFDTTTDEIGEFKLTVRRGGEYFIRCEARGWAPAEIGPIQLETDVVLSDLQLELTRGGAIEGRVLLGPGEDPAGWIIGASRGDIYGQTVTVGSDGRFRFEGLTPGPWWVGRMTGTHKSSSKTSSRKPSVWSGNCSVQLGQTTRFNVDLRDTRQTIINGSWKAGKLDLAEWTVRLRPGKLETVDDSRNVDTATMSSEGTFTVVAPAPGDYLLLIQHKGFPQKGILAIRQIYVDVDEVTWSETLRLSELQTHFDEADPNTPRDMPSEPRLVLIVPKNGGLTATALLPNGENAFTSNSAPIGQGSIHYMTPETEEASPIDWPVATTVEVH